MDTHCNPKVVDHMVALICVLNFYFFVLRAVHLKN